MSSHTKESFESTTGNREKTKREGGRGREGEREGGREGGRETPSEERVGVSCTCVCFL